MNKLRMLFRDDDNDTYGGGSGSVGGDWEKEFEVLKSTNKRSTTGEWNNNFEDKPKRGTEAYG